MKEQLISFETANLAKERGFEEKCANVYVSIGILEKITLSNNGIGILNFAQHQPNHYFENG